MAISQSDLETVNTGELGGRQDAAVTVALTNGSHVTAWNTDLDGTRDVRFRIFDAAGNAVGDAFQAHKGTAGNQVLTDIVATQDGGFTLVWITGTQVRTRSFDNDGNATSPEVRINVGTGTASGAQLVAVADDQYKVIFSSDSGGLVRVQQATFDTDGNLIEPRSTIATGLPAGSTVIEAVDGNLTNSEFILLSGGRVINSANGSTRLVGEAEDIIKFQNGLHVLAGEDGASTALTALFGPTNSNNFSVYGLGNPQSVDAPPAGTAPDVFDRALVDLGGNRILVVWVANTGVGAEDSDGIFALVYNANIGEFETTAVTDPLTGGVEEKVVAVQVSDLGNNANLALIDLEADRLADGRVTVSWSQNNGLTGFDVFNRILDARVGPITVSGTAVSGPVLGTDFDDTVSYADSSGGVRVDLDNPELNRGDAAGDILQSFETVIGTDFADQLHGHTVFPEFGDTANDTLLGGGGNDRLAGRGGIDWLDGGAGDDVISGGNVLDPLIPGDMPFPDDTILGGDGNDVLYGNWGDDVMDGGAGIDFLGGGLDDDTIDGGDGNDTINGAAGDDILDGGAGNDVIAGGVGFNVIEGGTGNDTASYASIPDIQDQGSSPFGFYVDLSYTADPVGNVDGYQPPDDLLSGIENIAGSGDHDYLAGNAGANALRGGDGDDFLFGRGGNDRLTGGKGADIFIFENPNGGTDLVLDFELGIDKIEIVSENFAGINAGNIADRLSINSIGKSKVGAPQFTLDNSGPGLGDLRFDPDGSGLGAAVLIATLTFTQELNSAADPPVVFSGTDFIFV